MPEDYGLYVTMLPDGKIKRDLTGPSGKVSLEESSIQNELILFSELSFLPYARVVDMICTSAAFLCINNGGRPTPGLVNPNVYEFIMETVADLVSTLTGENPLHGLLLWTAVEDFPADDGTDERRSRICRELLAMLEELMLFQFVVNEVLHDLAEGKSLAPEKYEGLWEMPVTEIVTAGDGLSTRYRFRSAVDYYHFLLLHFVAAKARVTFCQCCGRYFVSKTKQKTIYCDRIFKEGKTCKHWGPILKHQLEARDKVVWAYDQAQRRMYKRYERTADGKKKPTSKDLSYEEYYTWQERASKVRDDYLKEKITAEEALKTIDVP